MFLGLGLPITRRGFLTPVAPPFYDFSAASLPAGATLERASTGRRFNASGLLVSEAIDAARFDYDPATLGLLGLLVEPQRTNHCAYSTPGAVGWTATVNATLTPTAGVDLAGGSTAARVQLAAGASSSIRGPCGTGFSAGVLMAYSCWARLYPAAAAAGITVNLNSTLFTVNQVLGGGALSTAYQRFVSTAESDGAGSANEIQPDDLSSAGADMLIAHAQGEIYLAGQPAATSPIPTTGSAATRSADLLTLDLDDGDWDLSVVTPNGTFTTGSPVTVSGGVGYEFDWADLTGASSERHVLSIAATPA